MAHSSGACGWVGWVGGGAGPYHVGQRFGWLGRPAKGAWGGEGSSRGRGDGVGARAAGSVGGLQSRREGGAGRPGARGVAVRGALQGVGPAGPGAVPGGPGGAAGRKDGAIPVSALHPGRVLSKQQSTCASPSVQPPFCAAGCGPVHIAPRTGPGGHAHSAAVLALATPRPSTSNQSIPHAPPPQPQPPLPLDAWCVSSLRSPGARVCNSSPAWCRWCGPGTTHWRPPRRRTTSCACTTLTQR